VQQRYPLVAHGLEMSAARDHRNVVAAAASLAAMWPPTAPAPKMQIFMEGILEL
jgi:hypothetical protein